MTLKDGKAIAAYVIRRVPNDLPIWTGLSTRKSTNKGTPLYRFAQKFEWDHLCLALWRGFEQNPPTDEAVRSSLDESFPSEFTIAGKKHELYLRSQVVTRWAQDHKEEGCGALITRFAEMCSLPDRERSSLLWRIQAVFQK